ncbi:MAG: LCP family protein [Coriobacteriales bacterium]|jgi:LCP family protein required for cell wall assembly|nr:LCP family protein [Coriobacteriales bacterium]
MAFRSKKMTSAQVAPNSVNLVKARSAAYNEKYALSREVSSEGYAKVRQGRQTKRRLVVIVGAVLAALLIAGGVAAAYYYLIFIPGLNKTLGTDFAGNLVDFENSQAYEGVFSYPTAPEDPFYMLLLGTDSRGEEAGRSDTIILIRVDPKEKQVAMISIPRDTRVTIPGYGQQKINAAYAYGDAENAQALKNGKEPTTSGPAMAVRTVSDFAGVNIAYFAQIDFNGFKDLVDSIGGVWVDVPVAIVKDTDAGGSVDKGYQLLNGDQALVFVRSRKFPGYDDYQRQADQRIFLQALAEQVLSADKVKIASTVGGMSKMTFTNMNSDAIISLAMSLRGMETYNIHTYSVPSTTKMINGGSYVIADDTSWKSLMNNINNGIYPNPDTNARYQGVAPESYSAPADNTQSSGNTSSQNQQGSTGFLSPEQTANYVVDVRNGYGIAKAATTVSDKLVLAGYKKGEVGNANSYVYDTTLVIYKTDSDKNVAEDIVARLGYGRVVASSGNNYKFTGNILVVVGGDYPKSN